MRIAVYPDNGSDAPDETTQLGSAQVNLYNPDPTREQIFRFDHEILFSQGQKYWFIVDVPNYTNFNVADRNDWRLATNPAGVLPPQIEKLLLVPRG